MGDIHSIVDKWYSGYSPNKDASTYYDLALDVAIRYTLEQSGRPDVGRVLPEEYIYFMGNKKDTNYFCVEFHKGSLDFAQANAWDWSLTDPYVD